MKKRCLTGRPAGGGGRIQGGEQNWKKQKEGKPSITGRAYFSKKGAKFFLGGKRRSFEFMGGGDGEGD